VAMQLVVSNVREPAIELSGPRIARRHGSILVDALHLFFAMTLIAVLVAAETPCCAALAALTDPASQPADSDRAERARLSLDEIGPSPAFASPKASNSSNVSDAARRQLRVARDRMSEKAWSAAASALDRLLESEPDCLEARLLASRTAMQLGRNQTATDHLHEAVLLNPHSVAAHRLLGDIALQEGRPASAIAAYRAALASNESRADLPDTVLAQLSLGLALKREGYFRAAADAMTAFQAAVEKPGPALNNDAEFNEARNLYRGRLITLIGECRFKSGEFSRAIPELRAALKAAPTSGSIRRDLIVALARSGEGEEALSLARASVLEGGCTPAALSDLKQTCEMAGPAFPFGGQLNRLLEAPLKPDALLHIAAASQTAGDMRVAEAALTRVLAVDPRNPDALLTLVRLHIDSPAPQLLEALANAASSGETLDKLDTCIQQIAKAGRVQSLLTVAKERPDSGKDAGLAYIVARLRLEAGGVDEAAAEFESMLASDPSSLPASLGLMSVRMRQFRWEDAIAVGESAVAKEHVSALLQMQLARSYSALDQLDKAEAAYLESFSLARKDSTPLRELAELLERRGEPLRCEEVYRRIVNEVNPRDAVAREALVRLYLISDNIKAARKYFADFAELEQTGPTVESCAALMEFASGRGGDGRSRLEKYRSALRTVTQAHPDHVASRFDLAMTFSQLGEYEEATRWVDEALRIDAADLRTLELKAQLQTRALDFDGSLKTWRTLLAHRPRNAVWLEQLVEAHLTRADFDSAAAVLQDLLKRNDLATKHERYTRLLMAALAAGGHQDQALALATERLEAQPQDLSRRGRYLFELGRAGKHDEAIAAARRYLEKEPSDVTLRTLLIGRLDDAKRYVEAQSQLLSWLESTPEDYTLNDYLIIMHWRQRDWAGAIEVCRAAAETPVQRDRYQRLMAQTHLQAGQFDQGIEILESLATGKTGEELESTNVDIILALMQAERYADAEKAALRIVGPHIDRRAAGGMHDLQLILRFRGLLSNIYQAMNRMDEAYEQLVEIRNLNPADPESNNNLAYTWSEGGAHLDLAEKYVRAALAEEPRNAAYLDTLGWVLYKRGNFAEAARWLRLAMKQHDEKDPVMLNHLADALARSGDVDAAKPLWTEAHELVMQDKDENRTHERRQLRKSLETKMAALRDDKPVPTAPLGDESRKPGGHSATSQPSLDSE